MQERTKIISRESAGAALLLAAALSLTASESLAGGRSPDLPPSAAREAAPSTAPAPPTYDAPALAYACAAQLARDELTRAPTDKSAPETFDRLDIKKLAQRAWRQCGLSADSAAGQAAVKAVDDVFKAWLAAQKAKVEEDDEAQFKASEAPVHRLVDTYLDCLEASVRALAVVSNEPAETIVKAAFAACPRQALAIENFHRSELRQMAKRSFTAADAAARELEIEEEAHTIRAALDKSVTDNLLLEVLHQRAKTMPQPQPSPPPQSPEPEPHETPI